MVFMKNLKLTFIVWALPFILFAQEKQLKIDELMTNRSLYPTTVSNLQFMGNSNHYTFVANNKLVKGIANKASKDTILKIEDLNSLLTGLQAQKIQRIPSFDYLNANEAIFMHDNKVLKYDFAKKTLQILNSYNEKAENIGIEKNNFAIAYTIENNLYASAQGKEIAISQDGKSGLVYGKTVHRNEFGIDGGIFWSPKGNLLAFYRMDESMVSDYPLVETSKQRIAKLDEIKYPMAGMTSHEVTVGVYNFKSNKTIYLKTGEPKDQYLTNVTWALDEQSIYIAVLNRDQNHMKLNRYNTNSGELEQTIFEEKNDRYVEPQAGPAFINNKPDQFLWLSERDGYKHIYLYKTDGSLVKQLTSGQWIVKNIAGFDEKYENVYFYGTKDSPLQTHLYAVNIKTGVIQKITSNTGTHNVQFNKTGLFIDIYSDTKTAYKAQIIDEKGKVVQTIAEDVNPLKDYAMPTTEIFTIKAKDGTDLYCRMIKPHNFDARNKYPVFVYVYGGPHAQMITDSWLAGAGLFLNFMAQQGFIVWTVDNRGSANRGFEFESCIHRNTGNIEVSDQMDGVNYLKTLPYIKTDRIGVDGWSYGGFMTISLKLKNQGVFNVASAGGPVIDWKWYEIMYGERYMDTPDQNPEGYKNAALTNYVKNLEGKLMVIHGALDDVVVWQHSLEFINACIKAGKQVDYFVYPDHKHNVRGMDRTHLWQKIYEYHRDNNQLK